MDVRVFDRFNFFAGVPDSLLQPFYNYLVNKFGISDRHIIAPNEGCAVAIAAGHYLATGETPVVYLQNSGIGNIINPVASLLNDRVYAIPVLFIIGWRGEPGTKDEPQHICQGEITLKLLEDIDIKTIVIGKDTNEEDFENALLEFERLFSEGKSAAFLIRKGAMHYGSEVLYKNDNILVREDVIRQIVNAAGNGVIVATTGKASRELYEIREQNRQGHNRDFLTVGSMGHAGSIALGIALAKPDKKVWLIDGDGAALMHLGAMAQIGASCPHNLVHIVINNVSHESVGGAPTIAGKTDFVTIAKGCGYPVGLSVYKADELRRALEIAATARKLSFIEVKTIIGSRPELGRPKISPRENKELFMKEGRLM